MAADASILVRGPILLKKKRREWLVLSIQDEDLDTGASKVYVKRNSSLDLECLFLEAIVCVQGRRQLINPNNMALVADSITLIQCAPDSNAVQVVLEGMLLEPMKYSPSTLLIGDDDDKPPTSSSPQEIARIVRRLRGGEEIRIPRLRAPHMSKRDLALLDQLEDVGRSGQAGWKLQEPRLVAVKTPSEHSSSPTDSITLNLPTRTTTTERAAGDDSPPNTSRRSPNPARRFDYLLFKKQPQVQWMMQRILDLNYTPKHIVDIGGGRGDLAISGLAATFPDDSTHISIVDMNLSSLQAGQDYAKRLLGDTHSTQKRLHFIHADFYQVVQNPSAYLTGPPVDLVVALHACGDLSDLALQFAAKMGAPFVICPCCYTKQSLLTPYGFQASWRRQLENDDKTLGRLAELSEEPSVSKRAMTVINSIRLQDVAKEDGYRQVRLDEYESRSSGRNLVLVGVR